MRILIQLALTISYVTCIPIGAKYFNEDETLLEGLSKFLPLVGLLIGSILVTLLFALMQSRCNPFLSSSILIFAWLWLTGGLHMDGLMDTADGIYSHRSRERMLEIMQDSRVGNFAVLVSITVLALKIFALQSLNVSQAMAALILIPGWARACEVYAIGKFQYAREFGKGKVWHDTTIFPKDLFISIIPMAAATAVMSGFNLKAALTVTAGTLIAGVLAAHFLNAKLEGHTGDTYGAVVEIAETAGILIAALNL